MRGTSGAPCFGEKATPNAGLTESSTSRCRLIHPVRGVYLASNPLCEAAHNHTREYTGRSEPR